MVGNQIWSVSLDGQARPLPNTNPALDVAVSSDVARAVYLQPSALSDIWRIDLDSNRQERLISSTSWESNPQYSPDGKKIVFTSGRGGKPSMYVSDHEGSNLLKIGPGGSPHWSPDSSRIVFDSWSAKPGATDIYTVGTSGGPPRQITIDSSSDVLPSWSHDGKWIYFASIRSGEWQVWRVPREGENGVNAEQMTQGGGYRPIESTDGLYIYFVKRNPSPRVETSLWRVPVGGGPEELLIDPLKSSFRNWELTDQGIYYIDRLDSSQANWVIKFFDFDTRRTKQLTTLGQSPVFFGPAFSVSPDGRSILIAQDEPSSDLMLIENFSQAWR